MGWHRFHEICIVIQWLPLHNSAPPAPFSSRCYSPLNFLWHLLPGGPNLQNQSVSQSINQSCIRAVIFNLGGTLDSPGKILKSKCPRRAPGQLRQHLGEWPALGVTQLPGRFPVEWGRHREPPQRQEAQPLLTCDLGTLPNT